MYNCKVLNSEHRDLIHDVAFNWYGTHMATCSSDQTVRVWAKDPSTKQWKCTASWKCHSGSVWKVTWAHPEYGQVLATCSFDRTAAVWEEMPGDGPSIGSHGGDGSASGSGAGQSHWVRKTILVDSRTSVTDVKFGPRNLSGFMLATSSGDGTIRVYEALDVMNLSQWTLQHEIAVKLPLSCISWNHSINKNQAPMLAAGSDDPNAANGGKVFIYEFSESNRRWHRVETISTIADPVNDVSFAPNVGRSYSVLAVASKNLRIITLKSIAATASHSQSDDQHGITKYEVRQAGQFNDHNSTVWRVCWNTTGTVLASSGDDGHVRLWKSNYADQWKCVATLQGDGSSHLPAGAFVMTGQE